MDVNKGMVFLGAGRMATALARGFVAGQLVSPPDLAAVDPDPRARSAFQQAIPGARILERLDSSGGGPRWLILAVKPQMLDEALVGFRADPATCLLSVVAGITLERLERICGTKRIIRAMPNTPALVLAGATAWSPGSEATPEDLAWVDRLLGSVGVSIRVGEHLLDAVTGLSGSGPAYVFRFVEALIEGAIQAGLPRSEARRLAVQTLLGSARMLEQTGLHPRELADQVTSPGGTTAAGLRELDERGFSAAVASAVRAAAERGAELGRSSR